LQIGGRIPLKNHDRLKIRLSCSVVAFVSKWVLLRVVKSLEVEQVDLGGTVGIIGI
jgi:hypothetical protein